MSLTLSAHDNQALGIARYALDFLKGRHEIDPKVFHRVKLFHADSLGCALAALALKTRAPIILRDEALRYPSSQGACLIASSTRVFPEKAIAANVSAARELDANGTNFGYNPETNQKAGEFGHNDFYPVAIAAAQQRGLDGKRTLYAMLALDEIRGRLAEAFSLKDHKIDHVVHGGIASAAIYGAILGARVEEIESAIGYLVAHHIPFRAIRSGEQLSDSKGASAAITTEAAILGMLRSMRGFQGPQDIFRNSQGIFRLYGRPFDLHLSEDGDDFAIMGMHFKLGVYEHQSAGAIQGLINLFQKNPQLARDVDQIKKIEITIYEPAYGIICDPTKRTPKTRQSADHSLFYILATLLRKAYESPHSLRWQDLMLLPGDYDESSLSHPLTHKLIEKISIRHGGKKYDRLYPEGIPTSVKIDGRDSALIQFPMGHARGPQEGLEELLKLKFRRLAGLALDNPDPLWEKLMHFDELSAPDLLHLFDFSIKAV